MEAPDLDRWVDDAAVRVVHSAATDLDPARVWRAAMELRLEDTRVLGRLVRWRIPGVCAGASFQELFRAPPFLVLAEGELELVSGLVGRIWTLRRDYPVLRDTDEFRAWRRRGTVRVLFANWVAPTSSGGSVLHSETRVQSFGVQGRIGLSSLRPLIGGFHQLIATDAMAGAMRRAREQPFV